MPNYGNFDPYPHLYKNWHTDFVPVKLILFSSLHFVYAFFSSDMFLY